MFISSSKASFPASIRALTPKLLLISKESVTSSRLKSDGFTPNVFAILLFKAGVF